ncbi:vesicle-trafficking protein SEC22c [Ornithorhynchus anatinus]|uniref:SEC22 homolog C, vesicle trafficking protein n=1 Tax=Ornithorhynchus anatinus TaxID=9258 RepID=A0A6I8NYZ1_ORNAN|nr:vesicle-trafficking protein SEC22c [Ornithorhynchus anatinus]XP_028933550.1 vesicle-trafficking protein SEC22c [Ornithorhynchus anatinus]XP_028933553.1 vesicle-trafficking protein SEC22c [Ornithorhynchus anatinus]
MALILFACVVRVRDGLPLSASTDFHHDRGFEECRRRLWALSAMLAWGPARGSARGRDFSVHFHSCGDVACLGICSSQYPAAMAFCFLEELRWEFTAAYDTVSIGLASRPYAFREFDGVIQKVKWRFNCAPSSHLTDTLEKIQEELDLKPPVVLALDGPEMMNGAASGHCRRPEEPAASIRMKPVSALGILSLVLNIMCAALNLIRGVHLAENSLQEDCEGIGNALAFLISFGACIAQCHLYLFYSPARMPKAALALACVCLCNVSLYGRRNGWQILFHSGVAFLSSYQTLARRQQRDRQPDCGV